MTPNTAVDMIATLNDYDRFIQPYQAGIREINLRMDTLKNDFSNEFQHNPIHYIQTRVKTMKSIYGKLERRGYEPNFENAKNFLTDIAGIRIICYYTKDIYTVIDALHNMHDLEFPTEKNYIKTPKPNGYRSYHMIAVVPIHNIGTDYYPVEIQLRTLTMDTWAGMEHQIRYKAQLDNPDTVVDELREYAELLNNIEEKMNRLYLRVPFHHN
ncbi:MAG: RelA/SpoT domain protein [Oscillospiraceae bacterium]|nr:RelA/SpoT domain protein [Oscillospiraceae bacterium]